MKQYKRIRKLIILTLIIYSIVGMILQLFAPGRNEIFPIFSWALFAKVPNHINDYDILITSINGKSLHVPVRYNDSAEWFKKAKNINAYYVIQDLGYASSSGNVFKVEQVRRYFEPLYFGDVKSVTYKIVERTYDPLMLKKFGSIDDTQTLDTFEYHNKMR